MKKLIAIIVVILIVAAVAVALTNNSNKNKTAPTTTGTSASQTNTNKTTQNTSQAQATSTDKVSISNFAFSPDRITVKKGTTVTWTNKDNVAHTVTENDSNTGPNSSTLQPGASYSFTFNAAGVYNYHCSLHPDMMGSVTVTE